MSDKLQNVLEYNGYYGKVEFNSKDEILCGKIEFINDLVTFEADNVKDVINAFHEAVEDYLDICRRYEKEPEKPFKGSFNVRIDRELHKNIAIAALKEGLTLNQYVENSLRKQVDDSGSSKEHKDMMEQLSRVDYGIDCVNKSIWDMQHEPTKFSFVINQYKEKSNE